MEVLKSYLEIEHDRGRVCVRDATALEQMEGRGLYVIEHVAHDGSAGVLTTRGALPEAMEVARVFAAPKKEE